MKTPEVNTGPRGAALGGGRRFCLRAVKFQDDGQREQQARRPAAPLVTLLLCLIATAVHAAASSSRKDNLVVLDAAGVQNLRIETVVAEPGDFEETVFALGRIDGYQIGSASCSAI